MKDNIMDTTVVPSINNDSNVTSTNDLKQIIKKCPKCQKLTKNGDLIISHDQLPSILLKNDYPRQKKFHIISNFVLRGLGHWINLLVVQKKLYYFNGLTHLKIDPDLKKNILKFCKNNDLKFIDLSFPYQKSRSDRCGQLSCYLVYKSHTVNINSLMDFRKMMMQNSVATNENYMIRKMKKHFRLL